MSRLSYTSLLSEVSKLKALVVDLTEKWNLVVAKYNQLLAKYNQLLAENAALQARLAKSKQRLKKTSRNSNKPPSTDGLAKPKASGKKATSDLPSGGQPGHTGHTISRSDHVDHIEDHHPTVCAGCGGSLTPDPNATVTSVRQVQDLPTRQPLVNTDHRAMTCCCERCGTTTTGTFPADVTAPVQYGPRLNELAVYLWVDQLIPLRRIGQVISTMTDAQPSQGTIHTMIQSCARRFEPVYAHLGDLVKHEPVTHFDETGMRVAGSLNWVHVAGTATYCYDWLGRSRGDVMTDATGIAVHDHWPSYRCHQSEVHHAFCLAHLVRECQGLAESGEAWARKMTTLLYRIIRLGQRGLPLPVTLIAMVEKRYNHLVKDGLRDHLQLDLLPQKGKGRPPRRPGHNLVLRFKHHRDGTLRCLHNPLVPATNNLTERDLRPLKVKQKISGSFRTKAGARDFAVLRSVLETACCFLNYFNLDFSHYFGRSETKFIKMLLFFF